MNDYMHPSIAESLLIALIGFVTVFVVLIVLMAIIVLISKVFSDKKSKPAPVQQPAVPPAAPAEPREVYTGVKLNSVDEKTAAVLMAIVADKLDKPLENLRFISIKEVR